MANLYRQISVAKQLDTFRSIVGVCALTLALPMSARAQQAETMPLDAWRITGLSGIGVREIDSEGYAAPLVGFSATRIREGSVEFVAEGFVLLPTTETTGPQPISFSDENFEGFRERTTRDFDVVGLFRVNFWLSDWTVRPYIGLGGGLHVKDRSRTVVDVVRELPTETTETSTRDRSEKTLVLASLFAFGAEIPIAGTLAIRPELRTPIIPISQSVHTLGFSLGVSYSFR